MSNSLINYLPTKITLSYVVYADDTYIFASNNLINLHRALELVEYMIN